MNLYNKIKNKLVIKEYQLKYEILNSNIFLENKSPSNITFSLATKADIEEIRNVYKNEFSHYKYELFKKRLNDKTKIILISRSEKEISGYFNLSLSTTYESGIRQYIQVNNNESYFFDDYVFEKFRGRSIQYLSVLYRLDLVKKMDRKIVYVNIYSNNKPSRKSYEKIGFRLLKKYKFNKLLKNISCEIIG